MAPSFARSFILSILYPLLLPYLNSRMEIIGNVSADMGSMSFNQKIFTPTAPDKGSFPLDHENICKREMLQYMKCMRLSKYDNAQCRKESKDYLGCRMDNQLMTKEPWSKLGFDDTIEDKKPIVK